jgi:hypothetical protein
MPKRLLTYAESRLPTAQAPARIVLPVGSGASRRIMCSSTQPSFAIPHIATLSHTRDYFDAMAKTYLEPGAQK